jgi:vacuolar-type H+-ATPase subunit B/Vma2
MLNMSDIGNVSHKVGFQDVATASDDMTLYFDDSYSVAEFLRNIGESNAHVGARKMIGRDTATAALTIYDRLFREKGREGSISCT